MDYAVHGILQARILERVAFPFSRGFSQPRDRTQVSHMAGGLFASWATRDAQKQPRRSPNRNFLTVTGEDIEDESVKWFIQVHKVSGKPRCPECRGMALMSIVWYLCFRYYLVAISFIMVTTLYKQWNWGSKYLISSQTQTAKPYSAWLLTPCFISHLLAVSPCPPTRPNSNMSHQFISLYW